MGRSRAWTKDHPVVAKLIRQGRLPLDHAQGSAVTAVLNPIGPIRPICPKPRKHRNVPTPDSEGRIHPSKLQAIVTDRLRAEGWTVIPEVSMPLSERPKDRIRLDALAIKFRPGISESDWEPYYEVRFVEIKGQDLPTGIQKRRRFEDRYKIAIEVIKK